MMDICQTDRDSDLIKQVIDVGQVLEQQQVVFRFSRTVEAQEYLILCCYLSDISMCFCDHNNGLSSYAEKVVERGMYNICKQLTGINSLHGDVVNPILDKV